MTAEEHTYLGNKPLFSITKGETLKYILDCLKSACKPFKKASTQANLKQPLNENKYTQIYVEQVEVFIKSLPNVGIKNQYSDTFHGTKGVPDFYFHKVEEGVHHEPIFRDNPTKTNGPQPKKPDILPKVWIVAKRCGAIASLVLKPANSDYDSYGSKTGSEIDDYIRDRYTSEGAKKVMGSSTSMPIEYIAEYNKRNPDNRIVFRYMKNEEYEIRYTYYSQEYAPNLNPENFWCFKYITPDAYTSSKLAKSKLSLPKAPDIVVWTFEKSILLTKMPVGSGKYNKVKRKYNEPGGGKEAVIFQPFPIMGSFPLTK